MTANTPFVLYIFACLGLVVAVHWFPFFDLRGVGQLRRRRPGLEGDELEFAPTAAASARRERIEVIARADLTAMVALGGLAAVLVGAAIGFLGPRLIAAAMGDPGAAVWTSAHGLERLAQVVGAVCFGAVALRMLRLFLALGALVAATVLLLMAVNYVLARPIFSGLGF